MKNDPDNPRPTFTPEEIDKLLKRLKAFSQTPAKFSNKHSSEKRQLLWFYVRILLGTGMRPGKETESLTWFDYLMSKDPRGKWRSTFTVRPETNKTKRGRLVIIDDETNDEIHKLQMLQISWGLDGQKGRLFRTSDNQPATRMGDLFKKFLRENDLEETDRGEIRTTYSLRHYYCTQKLIAGVPPHILAKQTGHDPNILLNWYSKATPVDWADMLT